MKMVKKALAIVLALTLVVSMAVMTASAAETFTFKWSSGNYWKGGSCSPTVTPDANGAKIEWSGNFSNWKDAQVGAYGFGGKLTDATGVKFTANIGAAHNFNKGLNIKLKAGSTIFAVSAGTLSTTATEYKVDISTAKTDAQVAITPADYANITDVIIVFDKWVGSATDLAVDAYISNISVYTEDGSEATTTAAPTTTAAATTAAPTTTAAGTTAAEGTTVAPSTDRFTFKWNQTPKGYWEGGACTPTVTPDADGAKVEWSGTINGWKDAQIGAYAGIKGKLDGMDGIKFKGYYGDGHNFNKAVTVKLTVDGGKIYSKAVTLTKDNIEHVVLFEGAMTDAKDEITPDLYKNISVVTFAFDKWVGEDTPVKVNAYVGNFTAYKVGDALETTTADPNATTEAVDTAAAEKIVELLGELPEDLTDEFTYDQYIALESFLEEYATINNATVKYLADEHGITADVYTELLNLYNEMDIPANDDDNIGDEDEDNNDNNNAGTDDDDNASTGAAAPISILVMAAAAGVVLYKSKKR
ncbi:MAG: hypothetical protein IJF54_00815 [Clostridia bacterium]|nr:hypothetical protein [Clostridia bacterium]